MGIYGKLILVNKLIFSIVTASVITILFQKKVPSAPPKNAFHIREGHFLYLILRDNVLKMY